jgi:hypothetical protein
MGFRSNSRHLPPNLPEYIQRLVLSYLPQISRGNKAKTFKVIILIQKKIQVKKRQTFDQFLSLYFMNCFEWSRDCWPRSVKSHT